MKKIALLLGVIALWFSFAASPARATNVNIDGLPAASSVAGGNLWECEQGGVNNQCTSAQVAAYVYSLASGDCTITGVGAVVCTKTNGVSFSALATTVPATGIATWLGTPSSANLLAAMTDKTGTGTLVFGTAPTISSLNATVAMTLAFITGSTQCLQVNTSGVVSGTGAACGSGGGGAVSSVTGGIGVTVTPTTGAVVVSAPVVTRNTTATTDTITNTDRGTVITESNASPVAVAITNTGFVSTDYITVKNEGAGLATYTPSSGNIDGSGTLTLKQNQSTDIYFDGTNWWTLPGRPTNVACGDVSTGTCTIASGTAALGTGAITSATCATVVTVSATNVATTDVVTASFNSDPTAVTGYTPSASGMLTIIGYPTSGNVNFKVCNNTSGSITPGAITLNWRVVR